MDKRFWNFVNAKTGSTLTIDGEIAAYGWWGDEVTPKQFRKELASCKGDLTVWLNSPGGDVFAGSQIYTMLREYPGKVTVKIDGLAASAASVIAMAGAEILMSPTAMMMIHNPWTYAIGDESDMERSRQALVACKESILNAYEAKTGIARDTLSEMMSDQTWMPVQRAVELGFADGTLYPEDAKPKAATGMVFNSIIRPQEEKPNEQEESDTLNKLKNEIALLSL